MKNYLAEEKAIEGLFAPRYDDFEARATVKLQPNGHLQIRVELLDEMPAEETLEPITFERLQQMAAILGVTQINLTNSEFERGCDTCGAYDRNLYCFEAWS